MQDATEAGHLPPKIDSGIWKLTWRTFEIEVVVLLQGEGGYDWSSRTARVDARRAVAQRARQMVSSVASVLGERRIVTGARLSVAGVPESDSEVLAALQVDPVW